MSSSSILTVVSQFTQPSVILTPYLSAEGPKENDENPANGETSAVAFELTLLWDILFSLVDIALYHDTSDGLIARSELLAD